MYKTKCSLENWWLNRNLTYLQVGNREPNETREIQEVENFLNLFSNKHVINIHKFIKCLTQEVCIHRSFKSIFSNIPLKTLKVGL